MADKLLIDKYINENRFPESSFEISFHPAKHNLGAICARGHEYLGTGQSVRGVTHGNCMICMRLNAYVWRHENIERARASGRAYEATEKGKQLRKRATAAWLEKDESTIRKIFWSAQQRSKKAGCPFNLTIDICNSMLKKQGGRCYWTGIELAMKGPARHPLKASLDRLVPSLGYVDGNVVWASNFINRARSDTPVEEFVRVLDVIKRGLHTRAPA